MRWIAIAVVVGLAIAASMPGDRASPVRVREAQLAILPSNARDFAAGTEHRYAIELEHLVRSGTDQPFRMTVTGEWAIAVIDTNDNGTTIRAELRHPRVRVQDNDVELAGIAQPYTFTLGADGHVSALQLPHELSTEGRAILGTLATSSQLVDGHGDAWDASELDSLGRYDARYTRNGSKLAKTKLRYVPVADRPLDVTIVESATAFELRRDGWPETIVQHEQLHIGVDKASVVDDGRVRMTHAGVARVAVDVPHGLESVAIDATSSANRDAADRELVDGATLDDLLAGLVRVKDDSHASGYEYLRLAALFRIDGEAPRAAADAVIAGRYDPYASAAVIGALGEAGTPRAQTALASVLETDRLDASTRAHAALSLGLTPEPTADTLRTLATATRANDADVANTATLAIGNALRHTHDETYVGDLLARLRAATDDESRTLALRALGNTGDASIFPELAAALRGSDLVRAAAVEAMRFVDDPRVDPLIANALRDESSTVRGAAVFAAGFRTLDRLAAPLATSARVDIDTNVRRAIVELAGARMQELPALRSIVEYAAAHDADADLRKAAAELLSS